MTDTAYPTDPDTFTPLTPSPLDADFDDSTYEVDEDIDVDETSDEGASTGSSRGRATGGGSGGLTRQAARKVIEKYLELAEAPQSQLELLAATLGVKADPIELCSIITASGRTNLTALGDLASVAGASPFEAVLAAASLPKENVRRVWAVLTVLGAVEGGLPGKEMTAATRIAEAATALPGAALNDLDQVRSLGRK